MAAVQRARPSMGLQQELYRRSHRAPQPGEAHPEMLLDMLSMECQRRKHETSLPVDEVDHLDIDHLVNEFKIDDSISACFADIADDVAQTKGKKSKCGVLKDKAKSFEDDTSIAEDEPSKCDHSDSKVPTKRNVVPHAYRFRLPTAVRIRLKCGKKLKREQSEMDKIPYSTIQEQPEEELNCFNEGMLFPMAKSHVPSRTYVDSTHSAPVQKGTVGSFVTNNTVTDNSHAHVNSSPLKSESADEDHGLIIENTNHTSLLQSNKYEIHKDHSWEDQNKDIRDGDARYYLYQEDKSNTSENGGNCTCRVTDTELPPLYGQISDLFRRLESGPSDTQEILDTLLSSDDISTWRDVTGSNAVHRSVIAGSDQAMMITATSHPHLTSEANHSGVLPVDTAVQLGQAACLRTYINLSHTNSQISLTIDDIERLITTAIVGDQPECLTILLKEFKRKSPECTFVVDKGGNSPGHVAAKLGRLQCLHVLYRYEFDLTVCNGSGERPAHAAVKHGHHCCFRFLVQVESEVKLVEQIVDRACIIDRLEHAISRARQEIENNVHVANQQLSFWTEAEQECRKDLRAHVHTLQSVVEVADNDHKRNDLLHVLEKIEGHTHRDPTELVNGLRHVFRQILAAASDLDGLQSETQTKHESEVEANEWNVIIRSIHSSVEQSIFNEGPDLGFSADDKTVSYMSNSWGVEADIPSQRQLVNQGQRSLNSSDGATTSSVVPSTSTHLDADDESVTSFASASLGVRLSRGNNRALGQVARSVAAYNNESQITDESSDSDWSSSESSTVSSSRKWARFDQRGSRGRPSKMVYGMLLPDFHARHSSSSSSHTKYRNGASRHTTSRQKRRLSLWDLRELRAKRFKNIRLNIPNENLPDDILREHRIRQHVQTLHGSSTVQSDLVETITTASGEVYTEDLDRRYDPDFAIHLSKNDNSCHGKMIRFSSGLNSNIPSESVRLNSPGNTQESNQQRSNIKPKINLFRLITKLAKRSKRNKPMLPSSSSGLVAGLTSSGKAVREYTRTEFVERYKPRSLAQSQDQTTHMSSSSV